MTLDKKILEEKIDKIFKLWIDNPGAGGQLLVTYKGETLFEKCYGYANIETQTPITPDSVFHVASISKQFTAMAVLMLHEQGKLNVFDDVRKYIPDLINFQEPLTIKQMMNHVSGLKDHYSLFHIQGRSAEDLVQQKEMLKLIAKQTLNFKPNDEFMYSNANYVLLATIVERLTGMTLHQFLKENVFGPLGMDKTLIRDDPRGIIPNRVNSYSDNGYRYKNALLNLCMYGSTGVQSTCRDLTKYIKQYQNPTLISRKTMEEIMFDIPVRSDGKKGNYAGGVRIDELLGHRYIHHGGVNAGFRTFGVLFPDDDLIVTVFTNTYNIPIETAGRDVARIVLDLPERVPKSLAEFREDAPNFEGVGGLYYCDRNRDNFCIEVKDGVPYLDGVVLQPYDGSIYKQGRLNMTVSFGKEEIVICENGNIMHMRKITDYVDEAYMQKCVGRYYCAEAEGIWNVVIKDGKLVMENLRHPDKVLNWLQGDEFFTGLTKIQFIPEEDGSVNRFLYSTTQARNMKFERNNYV